MVDLELLAPARNADIGIAAIDCGADAVYIAGPEFGARQDAGNSIQDIRRLCEYAHRFGARIFLTLNTILYEDEIPAAKRLLDEAVKAGIDAVIAQDLAVFEILRSAQNDTNCHSEEAVRTLKNLPVHASTQCAIRTPEQARFYESLGASRIVLERQLSLDQIKAIRDAVTCEIEFFVHGALCVSYSGNCYMSEAVAGRSANRGSCVQACRSLYDLVDSNEKTLVKDKALLSLKDYNLIGRLSDLAEAGVCSFKIEGRLKNISYVRNTVRAYSMALDKLVASKPDKYRRSSFGKVEGGFNPDLAKTFNRGYTELFLDGKRGKWSSMDAPKSAGEEIGTITRITAWRPDSKREWTAPRLDGKPIESIEVLVRFDNPATIIRNGDGFSFISKDHNEIRGFRGDICRGERIVCKNVPGLYVGARLRRNLSGAFEKEMESDLPTRRIPVDISLRTNSGPNGYEIIAQAKSEDGREVSINVSAGNETAGNKDRMASIFESQINKSTGIYSFNLTSLEGRADDGALPFLPASAINGIRRAIAERLDSMKCRERPLGRSKIIDPGVSVSGQTTVSYKSNISNKTAKEVLRRLGTGEIEDAFEIRHKKEAELMRTKYCVRHELGICLKERGTAKDDLFLVNNGKRYRLGFDCSACEMTVSEA